MQRSVSPLLLAVYGTIAFVGYALHDLGGCGHAHPQQASQQVTVTCGPACCSPTTERDAQPPQPEHDDRDGQHHDRDNCIFCAHLALAQDTSTPPRLAAHGAARPTFRLRAESLIIVAPAHEPNSARGPPWLAQLG